MVIGYRKTLKCLLRGEAKLIIIANNIPKELLKNIEEIAKNLNVKIEFYQGSSLDLGILCGKPFPISTLAIVD